MLVAVEMTRIAISESSQTQVVWLTEKDGSRSFPILIGVFEAWAIERYLKKQSFVRPLTHDLMAGLITALKGDLKRIVITDIRDGTFYAKLVIERDGELIEVDSRPSDSIALATCLVAPIFVEENVLVSATQSAEAGSINPGLWGEGTISEENEDWDADPDDTDEDGE